MKRTKSNKKENDENIIESSFVFNLGRLWQEVLSEHWDSAIYLCEFINEVASLTIRKRYLKELQSLRRALNEKNSEYVDRVLREILKW